jgi:hypothetical protein
MYTHGFSTDCLTPARAARLITASKREVFSRALRVLLLLQCMADVFLCLKSGLGKAIQTPFLQADMNVIQIVYSRRYVRK